MIHHKLIIDRFETPGPWLDNGEIFDLLAVCCRPKQKKEIHSPSLSGWITKIQPSGERE